MRFLKRLVDAKMQASKGFVFDGNLLNYFFHSYNNFGLSERTIEIPIIKKYLSDRRYGNVLEIGNVSNYYYEDFCTLLPNKTVVDLYEKAYDIVKMDIKDYFSTQKFDFVFSISTFEHMDFDRGNNSKYLQGGSILSSYSFDNMQHVVNELLSDKGRFVITAPLGYSQEFDRSFFSDDFSHFAANDVKIIVLKKENELRWKEIKVEMIDKSFDYSFWNGTEYLGIIEICK
jgi:hypothetical protein